MENSILGKKASPEEQYNYVTKSKQTPKKTNPQAPSIVPKEEEKHPGRLTSAENKLKEHTGLIKEMNSNITKMMFIIIVLSVCLSAYKVGVLVRMGVNIESVIELCIAMALSYFGVNSTYKYTKFHPEKKEASE